jgi:Tfp pilus assembly protein PilN
MKHVLLVVAILAGVPACLPTFYLPESPPQMTTVQLPEAPDAAYLQARRAVAAMGGRILNYDVTTRMAFAQVPGSVVLYIAVLPDRNGAEILVTGHARSNRPVEDAWRALREYAALLHQEAAHE